MNRTGRRPAARPHSGPAALGRLGFVALVAVCSASPLSQAAVPIFGGPTYDSTTSTGYRNPALPVAPGATAGVGVAVGHAMRYAAGTYLGTRAVRWDASGAAPTELDTLGTDPNGYSYSVGYAVNVAGTAVGRSDKYVGGIDLGTRAVCWSAGGTSATELGNLGTNGNGVTSSQAMAINAAGTAAGAANKYAGNTGLGARAVRWDTGGTAATELAHLGTSADGSTTCRAYAINDAGTVVGFAEKYNGTSYRGYRAVRWDAGGTAATELGHIGTNSSGYTASYAEAVNEIGAAVGFAKTYNGNADLGQRAVRWQAGTTTATELGNLGTDPNGVAYSGASAINAAGTAVGYAGKYVGGAGRGERAVRWDAGSNAAIELGNLGTSTAGFSYNGANTINGAGTIVGYAWKYVAGSFVGSRAVEWGPDGVAVDLNTLLSPADAAYWTLSEARSISDTGWVTGIGEFDPDGSVGPLAAYDRMFLMQIPEPASLAVVALAGAAMLRRRPRHNPRSGAAVNFTPARTEVTPPPPSPPAPASPRP